MWTQGLFQNYILFIPVAAWIVAQGIKIILHRRYHGISSWHELFKSGGMPSSHSAFVLALTTAVGLKEGLDSSLFAVTLCFSGIVVYDAIHVRQEVGKHGRLLNANKSLFSKNTKGFPYEEHVGHTFWEAFFGSILGIALAFLLYYV